MNKFTQKKNMKRGCPILRLNDLFVQKSKYSEESRKVDEFFYFIFLICFWYLNFEQVKSQDY